MTHAAPKIIYHRASGTALAHHWSLVINLPVAVNALTAEAFRLLTRLTDPTYPPCTGTLQDTTELKFRAEVSPYPIPDPASAEPRH